MVIPFMSEFLSDEEIEAETDSPEMKKQDRTQSIQAVRRS